MNRCTEEDWKWMKAARVHSHGGDAPQGTVSIIPQLSRGFDPEQDLREDAGPQVGTSSGRRSCLREVTFTATGSSLKMADC